MIKKIGFAILFVVTLAVAAIVFTPLEFVLKQAGVDRTGAGWASVEGSLLKGRVNGFYIRNQPVGDVRLELKPMSLFSGKVTYDVTWSGVGGRGSGVVSATSKRLELSDIRAQQLVQSIEGLAPAVRSIGGEVRVADASATLTSAGCERAEGTLSTDTLALAAVQYGKSFGELSGPISCLEGRLVLNLEGRAENGDRVTVAASASPLGETTFAATVSTMDSDLVFILPRLGFERQGADWQYINNSTSRAVE